jgi:hypothetical protein
MDAFEFRFEHDILSEASGNVPEISGKFPHILNFRKIYNPRGEHRGYAMRFLCVMFFTLELPTI